MFKGLLKSKRGISPILATLLLIVIAVAAIIITYAWVTTYMTSTTSQAGVFLKKDNVNWATNQITIYVRNTGTSDATIDAVYIGTSSDNLARVPDANLTYSPATKIVSKDGGTITITVSNYAWSTQTTYHFRIAPTVGEALVFSQNSPTS